MIHILLLRRQSPWAVSLMLKESPSPGDRWETKESSESSHVLKVTLPVSQVQTQLLSVFGDGKVEARSEMT